MSCKGSDNRESSLLQFLLYPEKIFLLSWRRLQTVMHLLISVSSKISFLISVKVCYEKFALQVTKFKILIVGIQQPKNLIGTKIFTNYIILVK